MVSAEEVLTGLMVGTIAVAILVLLLVIGAKMRHGARMRGDFALLFAAFVVGWLAVELFALLAPPSLELAADWAHYGLILAFTIVLAIRWRWAIRSAMRGGGQ